MSLDNFGIAFEVNCIKQYNEKAVTPEITTDAYETGEVEGADRVRTKTYAGISIQTYTPGTALTLQDPTDSESVLVLDQRKGHYFKINSLEKFQDYCKDEKSDLVQRAAEQLKKAVDAYVLGLYGDAGAGNRVGTDYTTGTVEIAATTGVVTGTGTTFTSGMVGKGFKAAGHTSWYRVKTFTSTTSITIEDDLDDVDSAYTGGAISAGASYTIEAASVLAITEANVYQYACELENKLDDNEIPSEDRWWVVPSAGKKVLIQSSSLTPAVATAYEEVVKKRLLGTVAGFKVYMSKQTSGDNTNGYHSLAGHKSAIHFAVGFHDTRTQEVTGEPADAFLSVNVYGAKVPDERRKALAEIYATFNHS